jgi:hypothetical protein
MAKKLLMMMKKNGMTLLGAAILASGIFYVVNNPNLFTASILSLQEQNFITEAGRDVAYKTNEGYVDIFLGENTTAAKKIDFTISFNEDTVTIDPENISGQGTWNYTMTDNEIHIQSLINEDIDKTQSLIILPYT